MRFRGFPPLLHLWVERMRKLTEWLRPTFSGFTSPLTKYMIDDSPLDAQLLSNGDRRLSLPDDTYVVASDAKKNHTPIATINVCDNVNFQQPFL